MTNAVFGQCRCETQLHWMRCDEWSVAVPLHSSVNVNTIFNEYSNINRNTKWFLKKNIFNSVLSYICWTARHKHVPIADWNAKFKSSYSINSIYIFGQRPRKRTGNPISFESHLIARHMLENRIYRRNLVDAIFHNFQIQMQRNKVKVRDYFTLCTGKSNRLQNLLCTWSRHGRFWHENYGQNNEVWACRGSRRQRKVTMKRYSIFRNELNHLREVEQTAWTKLHMLHCSVGWLFGALLLVVATNVSMKLHSNVVRKQHVFHANKRDYFEFVWWYARLGEAEGEQESIAKVITQRQLHCRLVFLVLDLI